MPNDSTILSKVSSRDIHWDKYKSSAESISRTYTLAGENYYALRISKCAVDLSFVLSSLQNTIDTGELKLKLKQAHFCRVRHCPVCQWRRSLMYKAKAYQALPKLMADYPKIRFLFLTLTVRNCPLENLRCTIQHLHYSFKKLCSRKQFPGLGWVKTIEVTKSKDGTAHPHLHVLLAVERSYFGKNYLSKDKWIQLWRQCLKVDYSPSVHVTAIKSKGDNHDAIAYLTKYQTKASDVVSDPMWLQMLTEQLHKTRAFATGGILKDYFKDLEKDVDEYIGSDMDSNTQQTLNAEWQPDYQRYEIA